MTTQGQREVTCGVEMLFAPGAKSISIPQVTSRTQQPCALSYGYGLWHASIFKNISDPHYTVLPLSRASIPHRNPNVLPALDKKNRFYKIHFPLEKLNSREMNFVKGV